MRIGVDLGVSHIDIGLVGNDGTIIETCEKNWEPEDKINMRESIKTAIIEISRNLVEKHNLTFSDIELIGIGSPGTIIDGKMSNVNNLGIDEFDISKAIQEVIDVKVAVRNDAKCAAICEQKCGSLRKYSDSVFLVLGTGVGGAVFMDGKLLEPKRYSGFEIGHMTIIKDGNQCNCGKKGCFETYASMKTFKNMFADSFNLDKEKNIHSDDIYAIVEREKGNPEIERILDEYVDYLVVGLANLIDIFEPEAICLGGSFIYFKDLLFDKIVTKLSGKNVKFNKGPIPDIVIAEKGNNAGILGAAMQD